MAYVGVHQIRSFYIYAKVVRTYRVTATTKQLVSERRVTEKVVETRTPQKTYDEIGRYFAEMGIGEGLMPLILATPGDRLHWLTPEELKATGLATDQLDGEQLLARAMPCRPSRRRARLRGTVQGSGSRDQGSGLRAPQGVRSAHRPYDVAARVSRETRAAATLACGIGFSGDRTPDAEPETRADSEVCPHMFHVKQCRSNLGGNLRAQPRPSRRRDLNPCPPKPHLPMQNRPKISPSMSSTSTRPVIRPRAVVARRRSSARSSRSAGGPARKASSASAQTARCSR